MEARVARWVQELKGALAIVVVARPVRRTAKRANVTRGVAEGGLGRVMKPHRLPAPNPVTCKFANG